LTTVRSDLRSHAVAAKRGPAGLGALRTRVMLLTAVGALATGAGVATCPASAALLLPVLGALVTVVSLRFPPRVALAICVLVAVSFLPARLGVAVMTSDPAAAVAGFWAVLGSPSLLEASAWVSGVLGSSILLGSSLLGLWCSRGLSYSAAPVAAAEPGSGPAARLEWVLAEARRGRRLVTLGLVGVDAPAEYDVEPAEPAARADIMAQLDEMLMVSVTGEQSVSEYGPWERLLVLPDVWAEDFRDLAQNLVRTARQRIRRQVRVALITLPLDGAGDAEPLEYLERALEVCRAGRVSVSVGRPRIRRMTPNHEIA
jgi:hypothetical protein